MTPDDPRPRPDEPDAAAPSARDEQASALVDRVLGEVDETDVRHPPDVVARAAEMDAARAALRDVPPAGTAARDRAVATALAAYDEAAVTDPSGRRGQVADLGARRRGSAIPGRWLGAAAAAVLLIVVVVAGLVGSSSDDTSSDSATAALDSAEGGSAANDEASEEATEEAPAPSSADTTLAGSPLGTADSRAVDLGTFPSADALLDAAGDLPEAQRQAPGAVSSETGGGVPTEITPAPCPAGVPDPYERAGAGPLFVANGVVDGVTVGVWRVGLPEAARLVVVDPGCAVLAQRPVG